MQTRSSEIASAHDPAIAGGEEINRGIDWPRLYDLLLLILTRGRDGSYRDEVLNLARIAPGDRVLDVGCGTGTQALAAFRRTQPGGSVVGVDVSSNMLAVARRKARRAGVDIPFQYADAAELPFADRCFDVVTITTVMHMVPQNRRSLCLREAFRVLTPGGRLLLIDYAGDPDSRRGLIARRGLHRRFDLQKLHQPLVQEGFSEIESGSLRWLSLHFMRGTKR